MTDKEFDRFLEDAIDAPPPAYLADDFTPWRTAMNRILWGTVWTTITFNFLYLDVILPAVGHIMQLLGYHLVAHVNERDQGGRHVVSQRDVDEVVPMAVLVYERRALKPLVDELSELELKYLRAMSECLDEERFAATGVIAQTLGVESRSLSRARSRLIDNGTIAAPARGQVMFCVPYLADYVRRPQCANSAIEVARQRRV